MILQLPEDSPIYPLHRLQMKKTVHRFNIIVTHSFPELRPWLHVKIKWMPASLGIPKCTLIHWLKFNIAYYEKYSQ